jgi:hypothetical protein
MALFANIRQGWKGLLGTNTDATTILIVTLPITSLPITTLLIMTLLIMTILNMTLLITSSL